MTVAPTAPVKKSQTYTGNATEYITFFRYNRAGEIYAENKEIETSHYFQIDLWQKPTETKDLDELEKQAESVLKPLGFMGFTTQDLYENDTGINHIVIRCNYTEHL